jgi:putative intracellular protease/amidase
VPERRGRILIVLTSTARFDDGRRKAGYELTEVSRAWWVFVANGFEVVLASPRGGEPTMVLDRDDVTDADYAFLNDPAARRQLVATRTLASIDPAQFDGVYFAGGKGAMFDFPGDRDIARIVRDIAPRGVVGAVCHGPAALLGIELEPGVPLLRGRRVTGFTNAEETFLIEQAREVFPYLLQDELARQGGRFVEAPMFLENVVVDGRVVTGQNPWSTWGVAEAMVRALRHAPVHRAPTPEEASVDLLATYHARGLDAAFARKATGPQSDKRLLAMHAVVAAMEWRLGRAWDLHRLARR